MHTTQKRKICFVVTSKIHYARSWYILKELQRTKGIVLQLVLAGSAILSRHGDVESLVRHDGFSPVARVNMVLEGGSTVAMAKTTGLGILEFSTVFEKLRPHVVVVRGDRFEVLAPALTAAYMNCTVAHLEGGDVTGSIDESVRHAITKLSHIHFATNEQSRRRIVRMGEDPRYTFNIGAPEVEIAARMRGTITSRTINRYGVGGYIDTDKDFIIVMHHAVTTDKIGENEASMWELLRAIHEIRMPTVIFWPNIDAGANEISRAINHFRNKTDLDAFSRFLKYLEPKPFLALLKKARCLVGNSSAGIKECSFLGVPVVNIGSRQDGRLRSANVIDVPARASAIHKALEKQLSHGPYPKSTLYYKKGSARKVAHVLSSIPLYTQKCFCD